MFQPMVRVELPCLHTFSTKAGAQSIEQRPQGLALGPLRGGREQAAGLRP